VSGIEGRPRRARDEATSRRHARALRAKKKTDVRRRRLIVAAVLIVIVLPLAIAGSFLVVRALEVKDALEASQATLRQVQKGDVEIADGLASIGANAAIAAEATSDPVWAAAELVPWVGDNLKAVRIASETLDELSNRVGIPLLQATEAEGSLVSKLVPVLVPARTIIQQAVADVGSIRDSTSLIGPVRSGIDLVGDALDQFAPFVEVAPALLGADGPRNYLLVFQNNAELVALGGSAASQTLITVDQDGIRITQQASSHDFDNGSRVDVEVPESAIALYSPYLVTHVNTAGSQPDFPTAAKIWSAFWQRDISNVPIDGVISIDPIALSLMLRATGPVPLVTGDELREDNALWLILSESYRRWNGGEESDAFFASVAQSVFERVSSGQFDIMTMAQVVQAGIDHGNIMFWSANEAEQELVAQLPVAGILPVDNAEATTIGVFYRDNTATKIDFYTSAATSLTAQCNADGSRTFVASTALTLNLSEEAADELPSYVNTRALGPNLFSYEYMIYGPPGTQIESVSVGGENTTVVRTDIVDLGRPVALFTGTLRPGQTGGATATFIAPPGADFGPLKLRSTPVVQGTTATIEDAAC
jgi:hypothetical protein